MFERFSRFRSEGKSEKCEKFVRFEMNDHLEGLIVLKFGKF
jgi:hypothetical protein